MQQKTQHINSQIYNLINTQEKLKSIQEEKKKVYRLQNVKIQYQKSIIELLGDALKEHETQVEGKNWNIVQSNEDSKIMKWHYCLKCKQLRHCMHCCRLLISKIIMENQFCTLCREYGHLVQCCERTWHKIIKVQRRRNIADGMQNDRYKYQNYLVMDELEEDVVLYNLRLESNSMLEEKSVRDKMKRKKKWLNQHVIQKLKEVNKTFYQQLQMKQKQIDASSMQFIYQAVTLFLLQNPDVRLHFTLLETQIQHKSKLIDILLQTKGIGTIFLDPHDQKYKALWLSYQRLGLTQYHVNIGRQVRQQQLQQQQVLHSNESGISGAAGRGSRDSNEIISGNDLHHNVVSRASGNSGIEGLNAILGGNNSDESQRARGGSGGSGGPAVNVRSGSGGISAGLIMNLGAGRAGVGTDRISSSPNDGSAGYDIETSSNDEDNNNQYVISSTGASGSTNILGGNIGTDEEASSSRQSSDWALKDNKDIKAEEVRIQDIVTKVAENWIYDRDRHFDFYFYLDY
eukprot:403353044